MNRILLVLACGMIGGCTIGGTSSAGRENDRLRAQVAQQEEEIRLLKAENQEAAARASARRVAELPADVVEAIPYVASIEVGRLSSLSPYGAQPATSATIYVETLDGRNRFSQAVGTLHVELTASTENGKNQSVTAMVELAPGALRDAYRSGLTGTHYEVMLPLSSPLAREAGKNENLVVTARFSDALTGKTFTTERRISRPTGGK
jgi:hypothetical protein